MFNSIVNFFKSIPELWVFIISMIPFIELRGAIPVGAAMELPFYSNIIISIVGNMLPVPFILLLMPKILDFLGKYKFFAPFVNWLRKKAEKHKGKVITDENESALAEGSDLENSKKIRRKIGRGAFWALVAFVGIPLPGTGAWCGSLIAALFNLDKKSSALAVFLGIVISGIIMTLASYGVLGFLSFIL